MTKPLVAVLAGGRSTRMGSDKAFVTLAGSTMASWVVGAASQIGEVVVAGRTGTLEGAATVPDPSSGGRGPLAGLVAAFNAAPQGRPVVLLAVDQPWVRTDTLRAMVDRHDGITTVIPVDAGARQTTCALYPAGLREAANAMLEARGSIQRLLDLEGCDEVERAGWNEWGEDGRSWFSVDDRAALNLGLARFGPPGHG
jgi:molybdopterin-guanine dinucleotide biosynthesis protein A